MNFIDLVAAIAYNETGLSALNPLTTEQFCYLTTIGRVSGNPHTVEIWFAASADNLTIYILAGGGYRSDWVKNIGKDPVVKTLIADVSYTGRGRVVEDEAEAVTARKLVVAKYYNRTYNPTGGWEATALPVAIDLQAERTAE